MRLEVSESAMTLAVLYDWDQLRERESDWFELGSVLPLLLLLLLFLL